MIQAPPVQNAMASQTACLASLRQTLSAVVGAWSRRMRALRSPSTSALDPHEQVGPDRLRAGVAAPDAAGEAGHQEQPHRRRGSAAPVR